MGRTWHLIYTWKMSLPGCCVKGVGERGPAGAISRLGLGWGSALGRGEGSGETRVGSGYILEVKQYLRSAPWHVEQCLAQSQ